MSKAPKGKYLFGMVTVGEKGQIVIPKKARERYGIESGDELMLMGDDKGIAMIKSNTFLKMIEPYLQAEEEKE